MKTGLATHVLWENDFKIWRKYFQLREELIFSPLENLGDRCLRKLMNIKMIKIWRKHVIPKLQQM